MDQCLTDPRPRFPADLPLMAGLKMSRITGAASPVRCMRLSGFVFLRYRYQSA
jgi:hypothetical protein